MQTAVVVPQVPHQQQQIRYHCFKGDNEQQIIYQHKKTGQFRTKLSSAKQKIQQQLLQQASLSKRKLRVTSRMRLCSIHTSNDNSNEQAIDFAEVKQQLLALLQQGADSNSNTACDWVTTLLREQDCDWELITLDNGDAFYHNPTTGKSVWEIPSLETLREQEQRTAEEEAKKKQQKAATIANSKKRPLSNSSSSSSTTSEAMTSVASQAPDAKRQKQSSQPVASGSGNNKQHQNTKKPIATPSKLTPQQQAEANFIQMLREANVPVQTMFEKEQHKFTKDKRFNAIESHAQRKMLFVQYTHKRNEEIKQEKLKQRDAAQQSYSQLLDEANITSSAPSFEEFVQQFQNDERYKTIAQSLNDEERKKLFDARRLLAKSKLQANNLQLAQSQTASVKSDQAAKVEQERNRRKEQDEQQERERDREYKKRTQERSESRQLDKLMYQQKHNAMSKFHEVLEEFNARAKGCSFEELEHKLKFDDRFLGYGVLAEHERKRLYNEHMQDKANSSTYKPQQHHHSN